MDLGEWNRSRVSGAANVLYPGLTGGCMVCPH